MTDSVEILVINPGSTSTKIAVYRDEVEQFKATIAHRASELDRYACAADQYGFRKDAVLNTLRQNDFDLAKFNVIMAMGGALPPLRAGAYRINQAMVERLLKRPMLEHASNVAAVIAYELAEALGIPAFIYDGISTDELTDIARISGMPALPRGSLFHALNSRAVARKVARARQRRFDEMNLIVAHLGGGITLSVHRYGQTVDIVSDDEGPFSPERAGRVSCRNLIDLCFSGKYDHQTMRRMLRGKGGLVAYLGTNDAVEVEARINAGDAGALLVYEAMAYQIAKAIGELATVVDGRIDAIVLTGGLARSKMLVGWIVKRVAFIAPVEIVAGENELESLALGGLRVMRGEEPAHEYDLG